MVTLQTSSRKSGFGSTSLAQPRRPRSARSGSAGLSTGRSAAFLAFSGRGAQVQAGRARPRPRAFNLELARAGRPCLQEYTPAVPGTQRPPGLP